jgi:CRP-like cAMP-binding protein
MASANLPNNRGGNFAMRNFYALEFRELNSIRWQCEETDEIYGFRLTENGLIPIDAQDERCDIAVGRNALFIHTPNPIRERVPRPSGPPPTPVGEVFRLLAPLPEFESLDDQQLRRLAQKAIRREYQAGDTVFRQDDRGDSFFVIGEGHVRVIADDQNQQETYRGELGPGGCFGEMSLLTGAPRSATVLADTPCVVYEIQKDHLHEFMLTDPRLVAVLSDVMAERQVARAQRELFEATRTEHGPLAKSFAKKLSAFFGLD